MKSPINKSLIKLFIILVFPALLIAGDNDPDGLRKGLQLDLGKDLKDYALVYSEICGKFRGENENNKKIAVKTLSPHLMYGSFMSWDPPLGSKNTSELLKRQMKYYPQSGYINPEEADRTTAFDENRVVFMFDLIADKKLTLDEVKKTQLAVRIKYLVPSGEFVSALCYADEYVVHEPIQLPQAMAREWFFTIPFSATRDDGKFFLTIRKNFGSAVYISKVEIYKRLKPLKFHDDLDTESKNPPNK